MNGCKNKLLYLLGCLVTLCLWSTTALADHFTLTYNGSTYDSNADTTTFSYTLCYDGNPPGLSHFTLGVAVCDPELEVVASDPPGAGQPAVDGSTGLYGVKWDFGFDGLCEDYSVTFAGSHAETDVMAVAKAGSCQSGHCPQFFDTTGPACEMRPLEDLTLEPLCSPDPDTIRVWKVTNPNNVDVDFTWSVNGSAQSGNGTVPANDMTTFQTNTEVGDNSVTIEWHDGVENQTTSSDSSAEYCNRPPVCDANGPYTLPCGDGTGMVGLDGTGSTDPDQDQITYFWTTDCPDGSFDDDTSATPNLSLTTANPDNSPVSCNVYLVVYDDEQLSDECMSTVTSENCEVDCEGTLGGDAEFDECGVCEGNNEDKDDCGVCFGNNADQDDCDICFGNNEAQDECGVCFGNNEAKDVCGVCFGDGSTCLLQCENVDITNLQFELDGLGGDQRRIVRQSAKVYRRLGGGKKLAQSSKARADELYLDNWRVTWEMDSVQQINCDNAILCIEVDNTPMLSTYDLNAVELHGLAAKLLKRSKKLNGGTYTKKAKRLRKKNNKLLNEAGLVAAQVPVISNSCL